jgi:hypothetical protein
MSSRKNDDASRRPAELEDGDAASTAPRIFHVRTSAERSRAFYVDLSAVPESRRAAVMSQIRDLVTREGVALPNPSKSVESSPTED